MGREEDDLPTLMRGGQAIVSSSAAGVCLPPRSWIAASMRLRWRLESAVQVHLYYNLWLQGCQVNRTWVVPGHEPSWPFLPQAGVPPLASIDNARNPWSYPSPNFLPPWRFARHKLQSLAAPAPSPLSFLTLPLSILLTSPIIPPLFPRKIVHGMGRRPSAPAVLDLSLLVV
jgi:hypothetical protein